MKRDGAATRTIFGRSAELRVLSRAVAEVGCGHSRVVEVIGEPGIGKTRLLLELHHDTAASRMAVLSGRGSEADRDTPFALFADAFDTYLAGIDPQRRAALLADPALAKLACLPRTAAAAPIGTDDRRQLHRAVRDMLVEIAGQHGLAVLLDDVHWADLESVELLVHLVRHPPSGPVLLVIAHRPKQSATRLAAPLSAAARLGLHQVLHLRPLDLPAADELLGTVAPESDRADRIALYRASGGNPCYLEILAQARHGDDADADGPCPRLTAVLQAELSALDPTARAVLGAAAVLGEPFEPSLVAEVAGLRPDGIFPAMDDLSGRDLVRQLGTSSRFAFRHPVVRYVTYRAIGPGERIAAHARALHVLRARAAAAPVLAPHVERTASAGDTEAAAVLADAALIALDRDPGSAAQWLQTALRLLPDRADLRGRRRELLLPLAEAHARAGRLLDTEAALSQAIDLLEPDQWHAFARLVAQRAVATRLLGKYNQAVTRTGDALSAAPEEGGAEWVALVVERTINAVLAGVHRVDLELGRVDAAVRAAADLDDRGLHTSALAAAAFARIALGEYDAADALVAEAAARADELTDDDLLANLDAVVWLTWCEIHVGAPSSAVRHLEQVLALARAKGRAVDLPRLLGALSAALLDLGSVDAAVERADEAVEAAAVLPMPRLRAAALFAQCRALTGRGAGTAAVEAGLAATAVSGRAQDLWWALAWLGLAEAQLTHGDANGALAAAAVVVGVDEPGSAALTSVFPAARAKAVELLVRIELAAGRTERARAWAALAAGLGDRFTPFADLAHAHVVAEADPAAAAVTAARADTAFTARGRMLSAGRARLVAASALVAAGKRTAGAELFRAEQLLRECGATGLVERAMLEQRKLAKAATGPDGGGLSALTARERQVAHLVTNGHTNRQIAQRLGVSDKTVEAHLARVFTKFGVGCRAAVASVVARSRTANGFLSVTT